METYDSLLQQNTTPTTLDPLSMLGIDPTMLLIFFALSTAITVLIVGIMLINSIRAWRVQSAILQIAKDVRELKQAQLTTSPTPQSATTHATDTSEPTSGKDDVS